MSDELTPERVVFDHDSYFETRDIGSPRESEPGWGLIVAFALAWAFGPGAIALMVLLWGTAAGDSGFQAAVVLVVVLVVLAMIWTAIVTSELSPMQRAGARRDV